MERTGAKFSATGYGWMDEEGNDLHVFIPPKKTDYKKMIRLSQSIGASDCTKKRLCPVAPDSEKDGLLLRDGGSSWYISHGSCRLGVQQ